MLKRSRNTYSLLSMIKLLSDNGEKEEILRIEFAAKY